MNLRAIPIVKLELEGMKHSILTHLGLATNELSEAVSAQIEKAIESFDFSDAVLRASSGAIAETIEDYFKYGQGRQFIQQAIQDAFSKMFLSNDGET